LKNEEAQQEEDRRESGDGAGRRGHRGV